MARINAAGQDFTNESDGGNLGGGVTKRFLRWLGADITLTGSGSNTYTMPASTDTLLGTQSSEITTGWQDYTAVTPTRQSADDPTYVLRFAANMTGRLSAGMRISWIQNSARRYGIVTVVGSFTSGNTDITILTRCNDASGDYDVLDTGTYTISGVKFSNQKAPFGFPLDPSVWTVELYDTTNHVVNTPGPSWLDAGSLSLSMPIGCWNVKLNANTLSTASGTDVQYKISISTSSSSESNSRFTRWGRIIIPSGSPSTGLPFWVEDIMTVASKTTLYLIMQSASSPASIWMRGGDAPTKLQFICAYL